MNYWLGKKGSAAINNQDQDYNGLFPGILTTDPFGLNSALRRQLLVDRSMLCTNLFLDVFKFSPRILNTSAKKKVRLKA